VGSNLGRRGGKPATNRLSYVAAWFNDKYDTSDDGGDDDDDGTATTSSSDADEPRDAGPPSTHLFHIPYFQNSNSGLEIG
jgi:hypothetical protein